jgi:putative oxidoreductase
MSVSMASNLTRKWDDAAARNWIHSERLVPIGRALYAAIFILASFSHFARPTIDYAAKQGVPFAGFLVPASGLMALIGGLSVMTGYRARIGAGLLILFLLPVTFAMHAFWAVQDPHMAELQRAMFFKNVALVGAAMLLVHFGAGPYSLDARHATA